MGETSQYQGSQQKMPMICFFNQPIKYKIDSHKVNQHHDDKEKRSHDQFRNLSNIWEKLINIKEVNGNCQGYVYLMNQSNARLTVITSINI